MMLCRNEVKSMESIKAVISCPTTTSRDTFKTPESIKTEISSKKSFLRLNKLQITQSEQHIRKWILKEDSFVSRF